MIRLFFTVILALATTLPPIAWAGSSEAGKSIIPSEQVATFSNRVQQDLAARGVNVAIVARMGRNPSTLPNGITYTHVGFWVYSQITLEDGSTGRGYRVYNLYQQSGNKTRSNLIQDSPADFFAGAYKLDAGIIIPDPRLQKKLLKVIASSTYSNLHNANYSVLSNPSTSQFQNCTEHTLDVIMASLYKTSDKRKIKANITAHFEPQIVPISMAKRNLASFASKAMTTTDQGSKVGIVTFGSIAQFMRTHDLTSKVYRLTPTKTLRF